MQHALDLPLEISQDFPQTDNPSPRCPSFASPLISPFGAISLSPLLAIPESFHVVTTRTLIPCIITARNT